MKLLILLLLTVISIVHGAPKPQVAAVVAGSASELGALQRKAIDAGLSVLNSLSDNEFSNEALYCIWNDWESRDQVARIQCTYNGGRFSKVYRTLGIPNGRWYCTYKKSAYEALGHSASCRDRAHHTHHSTRISSPDTPHHTAMRCAPSAGPDCYMVN